MDPWKSRDWRTDWLTEARGQKGRYGGAFWANSKILCMQFCHHLHTEPFPSSPALASGNLLMTRKAELGQSKPLHSSTCSRTRSLWCNGRSGDQGKIRRQMTPDSSDTQSLGRMKISKCLELILTKWEKWSCAFSPPTLHTSNHGAVTNYLQQIRNCLQKHTHVQNGAIIWT